MSFNQINIVGRLGRDVEVRQTDKTKIATFSVATDWRDKDGERKAVWFRVVAFGRLAEFASMYFVKGSTIYVSGELSPDEWTDRDGNKRTTLEVRADKINFLPKGLDVSENAPDDELIGMANEAREMLPPSNEDIPF